MRTLNLSKDDILERALAFVKDQGIQRLSMRTLSAHTGVSVGTLYNYFGDKDQFAKELMETYWKDAIEKMDTNRPCSIQLSDMLDKFYEEIHRLSIDFQRDFIKDNQQIPSSSIVKQSMSTILTLLKESVTFSLESVPYDERIYGTKTGFVELLMDVIFACLLRNDPDLGSFGLMIRSLEKQQQISI